MARRFLMMAMLGLVCCSGGHGGDPGGHGGATGASSSTGTSTGQGGGSQCGIGQGSDPVDLFCNTVTTPYCEAIFSCCNDPLQLADFGGTLDGCKAKWGAVCYNEYQNQTYIGYHVSMGSVVLDQSTLSACVCALNELAKGGASCTMPPRWYFELNCVTAFKGNTPPGASCAGDIDAFVPCKDGKCENATCVPFLDIGAPCVYGGDCNLSEGNSCLFKGGTGTCGPRRHLGEACTQGNQFECWSHACDNNGVCVLPSASALCNKY